MMAVRNTMFRTLRHASALSYFSKRAVSIFSVVRNKQCDKQQEFYTVYRSSVIPVCSIVNKIKKIQLFGCGVGLPTSCLMHWANFLDASSLLAIGTVGIGSTAAVFCVSELFTNLIGFVYISKDLTEVKISYLDYWGKRKDVITNLSDIGPLGLNSKLYFLVKRLSSNESFKLSMKFGEIINTEAFVKIFKYDPGYTE